MMKAEELVIKMNKVDLKDILFEKLLHNEITKEDAYVIGQGLGKSLSKVRNPLLGSYNYYEVFERRIIDAKAWMSSETDSIPVMEIEEYAAQLMLFRELYKDLFENQLSNEMAYGGDIHSHNALYSNTEFLLMDTFSPKDDWLTDYHAVPVYRIATDIWVMSGDKSLFEACIEGYEKTSGLKLTRSLDRVFVLYALMIATPYHYMLEKTDKAMEIAAKRFSTFMREYFIKLKQ